MVKSAQVENPGQFWINYSSHTKALDEMVDRINEGLVHVPIHSSKVVPNAMCIAPYQGRYYRAKIVLVVPYPIDDSLVCFNTDDYVTYNYKCMTNFPLNCRCILLIMETLLG